MISRKDKTLKMYRCMLWIIVSGMLLLPVIGSVKSTNCAADKNVTSACIGDSKPLQVVCEAGHVVANVDVTAGFSNKACRFDPDQCRDVTSLKFTEVKPFCVWKERCCEFPSVTEETVLSDVSCDGSGERRFPVDFIQANNVMCVNESLVLQMCTRRDPVHFLTQGFILSPGYTIPYKQHNNNKPFDCFFEMDLSVRGHDVMITSLDMDMYRSESGTGPCTLDYLYIQSLRTDKILRYCGNDVVNESFSGPIRVGIKSGYINKHHKGFLLKFKAIPLRVQTTTWKSTISQTSPKSITTTTGYVSSSPPDGSTSVFATLRMTILIILMLIIK